MQEAIVSEMRSVRLDMHARSKFTESGEPIKDSRELLYDKLYPEEALKRQQMHQMKQSARSLQVAASADQFDVG